MAFPEVLRSILPTEEELSKGIRSNVLVCPRRSKGCGNRCVDCLQAKEYHNAFRGMHEFPVTTTVSIDNSIQTYCPGIGTLEIRNGKIYYELSKKI